MASKPTIVLVAGSCHTAHHFADLQGNLQKHEHPVCCTQLASVDCVDPAACHMSKDIEAIKQEVLRPLLDRGSNILLVCHSAAGYAGGAAALGCSRMERKAAGEEGGIVGVIFIAAFLAYKGAMPISKRPDGSWHPDFAVDVSTLSVRIASQLLSCQAYQMLHRSYVNSSLVSRMLFVWSIYYC